MMSDYRQELLEKQGVSPSLIQEIQRFRERYPVQEKVKSRLAKPEMPFFGKEILEMAVAGLLQGENILLSGSKATGKNILAENLAISCPFPLIFLKHI